MRPQVVATYASKRRSVRQRHLYSTVLQNYRGDDEQCKAVINAGEEHKFDMKEILLHTFNQLYLKEEARGDADVGELIRALKSGTYGEGMTADAIECEKRLIDYAVKYSKLHIVDQVNATLASAHIGQFTPAA